MSAASEASSEYDAPRKLLVTACLPVLSPHSRAFSIWIVKQLWLTVQNVWPEKLRSLIGEEAKYSHKHRMERAIWTDISQLALVDILPHTMASTINLPDSVGPELSSMYVTAQDLYKIQRRGPTLGGGVLPQHVTCRYPSKVCGNPRAFKANGELHRFCDYHRYRANVNQKRWSNSRRRYGNRAPIETQMLMPKHDAIGFCSSAAEAIEGFENAFSFTNSIFEAFPVDMSLTFDDENIDSLLQELLYDSPNRLAEDNSSQPRENILV